MASSRCALPPATWWSCWRTWTRPQPTASPSSLPAGCRRSELLDAVQSVCPAFPFGGDMKAPARLLVAALLALPGFLVAQTGPANGSLPRTPQGLLGLLAGTWHFDLYSQASRSPVASGEREMRLLADSTKLAWTDTVTGRPGAGTGILGYNAATGVYY